MEAFARYLVTRYGADEVRRWPFTVCNDPNLAGFWAGVDQQARFRALCQQRAHAQARGCSAAGGRPVHRSFLDSGRYRLKLRRTGIQTNDTHTACLSMGKPGAQTADRPEMDLSVRVGEGSRLRRTLRMRSHDVLLLTREPLPAT